MAFSVGRIGIGAGWAMPAYKIKTLRHAESGKPQEEGQAVPAFHPELRRREKDILSATITLDDVKTLFLEYTAKDVPFHQPLRLEPWGARTFIVCDPDQNLIAFAG